MKLSSILMMGFLVLAPLSVSFEQEIEQPTRSYIDSSVDVELKYTQEAQTIKDLIRHDGLTADTIVIVKMLKAIDHNVPKYFHNGPYTRNDFIALAWLESAFHQHEVGTHGERGLFQIMPDEFEDWHVKDNFFDINVNTKMGFRVLDGKYKRWHDYKKAIQAYNGVIRLKNGKWSEKYWKAFEKRKIAIDLVLNIK